MLSTENVGRRPINRVEAAASDHASVGSDCSGAASLRPNSVHIRRPVVAFEFQPAYGSAAFRYDGRRRGGVSKCVAALRYSERGAGHVVPDASYVDNLRDRLYDFRRRFGRVLHWPGLARGRCWRLGWRLRLTNITRGSNSLGWCWCRCFSLRPTSGRLRGRVLGNVRNHEINFGATLYLFSSEWKFTKNGIACHTRFRLPLDATQLELTIGQGSPGIVERLPDQRRNLDHRRLRQDKIYR